MNYLKYETVTPEEVELMKAVNLPEKKFVCKCAIHETKPSFCREGPLLVSLMPDCGYYFEKGDEDNIIRKGECLNCGRCCVLPRKDGSPYGFYDPLGSRCVNLKVEEK